MKVKSESEVDESGSFLLLSHHFSEFHCLRLVFEDTVLKIISMKRISENIF